MAGVEPGPPSGREAATLRGYESSESDGGSVLWESGSEMSSGPIDLSGNDNGIGSWNIGGGFRKHLLTLVDVMNVADLWVLGVQETRLKPEDEKWARRTLRHHGLSLLTSAPAPDDSGAGVALLYRTSSGNPLRVSRVPGRMVSATWLPKGRFSQEVTLISFYGYVSGNAKAKSPEEAALWSSLRDMVATCNAHGDPKPCIIMGDFNDIADPDLDREDNGVAVGNPRELLNTHLRPEAVDMFRALHPRRRTYTNFPPRKLADGRTPGARAPSRLVLGES